MTVWPLYFDIHNGAHVGFVGNLSLVEDLSTKTVDFRAFFLLLLDDVDEVGIRNSAEFWLWLPVVNEHTLDEHFDLLTRSEVIQVDAVVPELFPGPHCSQVCTVELLPKLRWDRRVHDAFSSEPAHLEHCASELLHLTASVKKDFAFPVTMIHVRDAH